MKKHLFKPILIIFYAFCLAAALCACAQTDELPQQTSEITVTPELRQEYFALARLNVWQYLPEFSSVDDLPADPLMYWFMITTSGATGWDNRGNLQIESPWLKPGPVEIDSRYYPNSLNIGDVDDYLAVSAEEFDVWLQQHFGAAPIVHEVSNPIATYNNKYFHCDGQTYYNTNMEGIYPNYYGLTALSAQDIDGHTVYTATLDNYWFHEYCIFAYDDNASPEENMAWYASILDGAPPENLAFYAVYGEQIKQNEMSGDQAIERMIIDGDTANFRSIERLTVQFYINEETQEPFYLSVEKQKFY